MQTLPPHHQLPCHGKEVPGGMSFAVVVDLLQVLLVGEIKWLNYILFNVFEIAIRLFLS